jgi:LPXTG-motif cell wall-anchored protein
MKRSTAAIILSAATFLLLLGSPAFAAYPPGGPTAVASDTTVSPGQTITASGNKWLADSTVRLYLGGAFIKTAAVDPGHFSTTLTIPSTAKSGQLPLTVRGLDSASAAAEVTIMLTVDPAGSTGSLAFTGANVTGWMILVPVLLLLGAAFLVAGRKRRSRQKAGSVAR